MSEKIITQQLKDENENENEKLKKNNKIVKGTNIKKLIKEPKEIKSPNWLDKNKLKEILTVIDIKDLVNNNKDNTISEIDTKKRLNTLNKIKNAEIKYKRLIPGQNELLNLFNDLPGIILTDKTLMSSKDENGKLKVEKENENEDEDDITKILIHSNEYDEETNQHKKIKE